MATSRVFLAPAGAGFAALVIGVGLSRFGYPPIIPVMVTAGWANPAELHFAGAWNFAGYMAGAMAAIPLLHRFVPRSLVLACALLGTFAFAASAIPLPVPVFMGLRAISGLIGGVLMIVVPPIVLNVVEPGMRGRASGLMFAGVGFGFVLSGTAIPVLGQFGPATTWIALTTTMAVATLATGILLPETTSQAIVGSDADQGAARRDNAWAKPAFIGLALAYAAAAAGYIPHTLFLVDHVARDLGYGLAAGGTIWIVAGATAAISPVIAGYAADRFGFAISLRVVVGLMAVGAALPALTTSYPLLGLSAMLCSGLMIGLGSLASGRTREIVGAHAYAGAWSAQTVLFALMQMLGGYGFSGLLAATDSHENVFATAAVIIAGGLTLEMLLARRNRA